MEKGRSPRGSDHSCHYPGNSEIYQSFLHCHTSQAGGDQPVSSYWQISAAVQQDTHGSALINHQSPPAILLSSCPEIFVSSCQLLLGLLATGAIGFPILCPIFESFSDLLARNRPGLLRLDFLGIRHSSLTKHQLVSKASCSSSAALSSAPPFVLADPRTEARSPTEGRAGGRGHSTLPTDKQKRAKWLSLSPREATCSLSLLLLSLSVCLCLASSLSSVVQPLGVQLHGRPLRREDGGRGGLVVAIHFES